VNDLDDDRACDWCGDFEDIAGPLELVFCFDGSTMWLCATCVEDNDD